MCGKLYSQLNWKRTTIQRIEYILANDIYIPNLSGIFHFLIKSHVFYPIFFFTKKKTLFLFFEFMRYRWSNLGCTSIFIQQDERKKITTHLLNVFCMREKMVISEALHQVNWVKCYSTLFAALFALKPSQNIYLT